jgi:C-terminal processing protease CtpA/Prc
VTFSLSDRPDDPRRQVAVVPTWEESRFRYLDWVERNRKMVEAASDGRIGYIHLPDTFTGAANMFPLWYGQTRKEGIVVDGRFNAGGLDPAVFLERLEKPILFYWTRRHSRDYATPLVATRAHLALVTNRQAGSGGDMLPAEFKLRKLGPVIGTRTWGGLVGISTFASCSESPASARSWSGMVTGIVLPPLEILTAPHDRKKTEFRDARLPRLEISGHQGAVS